MTFQKDFRALPREHLAIDRIGIRHAHHEPGDLGGHTRQIPLRESEGDLGFSRRMGQR